MLIKWFGGSCLCFQDSLGHKILTDPLDDMLTFKSDIITFSQKTRNYYSYYYSNNKNILLDSSGSFNYSFISINGYTSHSDNMNGIKRGKNIIYKYAIDNLILCHLGQLGDFISDDLISNIGLIDIAFVPIDGNFTLDYISSTKLVNKLNPKIIIPICYKSYQTDLYNNTLKNFLLINKAKSKVFLNVLDTSDIANFNKSTIIILKNMKTDI